MASKQKSLYVCQNCGYESVKWYGKCPTCGEWNTMEEQQPIALTSKKSSPSRTRAAISSIQKLSEINSDIETRLTSGIKEFDRVLGGGIVEGSLVLLSGDPGIGKSTILLQICQSLCKTKKVLYISGEESARQIKLRADRLSVGVHKHFYAPRQKSRNTDIHCRSCK